MAGNTYFDREKLHINVARLKTQGETFEVVIDPDKYVERLEGKDVPLTDLIRSQEIFSDSRKGQLASTERLRQIFGTSDSLDIIRKILAEGEIQLNAEYRAKLREEKRKQIISLISRNAIDPRTNLPHPPQRIELALHEAKAGIDEHKSAEEQVQSIVKQLMHVLPIRFEIKKVSITVPVKYAASCYSIIKSHSKILEDNWLSDGSRKVVVEAPLGMYTQLMDRLNDATHGSIITEEVKR